MGIWDFTDNNNAIAISSIWKDSCNIKMILVMRLRLGMQANVLPTHQLLEIRILVAVDKTICTGCSITMIDNVSTSMDTTLSHRYKVLPERILSYVHFTSFFL